MSTYWIVLEGGEGSGKSTMMQHASKLLETRGIGHITTREPGGTQFGEKLRELLLAGATEHWREQLLLFLAARHSHINKVIRPMLKEGMCVLCDRYDLSTFAYQVMGELSWKDWRQLQYLTGTAYYPDLYLVLEVSPEVGLKRAKDPNYFESKGLAFHQKVSDGIKMAGSMAMRDNEISHNGRALQCQWLDTTTLELEAVKSAVTSAVDTLIDGR